jgi:hypothetical protein
MSDYNTTHPLSSNSGSNKTRTRNQRGLSVRLRPVAFLESELWSQLSSHLRGFWRAVRIESGRTVGGISDVSFTAHGVRGWLELKVWHSLGFNDDAPIRMSHFTKQQHDFLMNEGRAAGAAWLLLDIVYPDQTHQSLLFAWEDVTPLYRGELTVAKARSIATLIGHGGVRGFTPSILARTLASRARSGLDYSIAQRPSLRGGDDAA